MVASNVTALAGGNVFARASKLYRSGAAVASQMQWVALFAGRLLVARVFLLSGLTKWDGLSIRDDTFYLFANEYFPRYALPQALTNAFAVASSIGEIALPVLLVLGLFTRAAALGLLGMTLVIQIFVYPEAWWAVHAWWVGVLFLIIAHGPGAASLDRRIGLD
jgi:putative oxidoreductase